MGADYGSSARWAEDGALDLTSSVRRPEHSTNRRSLQTRSGRTLRMRSNRRGSSDRQQTRYALQDMSRPLKQWLIRHRDHPYPSKVEKVALALESRMTLIQVSNWFANARRRLKNTVRGLGLTWGQRVRLYNSYVSGNAEPLSISSDDSIWDSDSDEDESVKLEQMRAKDEEERMHDEHSYSQQQQHHHHSRSFHHQQQMMMSNKRKRDSTLVSSDTDEEDGRRTVKRRTLMTTTISGCMHTANTGETYRLFKAIGQQPQQVKMSTSTGCSDDDSDQDEEVVPPKYKTLILHRYLNNGTIDHRAPAISFKRQLPPMETVSSVKVRRTERNDLRGNHNSKLQNSSSAEKKDKDEEEVRSDQESEDTIAFQRELEAAEALTTLSRKKFSSQQHQKIITTYHRNTDFSSEERNTPFT